MTVKGLEPEIQKLIAQSKKDLDAAREREEESLRKQREQFQKELELAQEQWKKQAQTQVKRT